jgi:hypothetical protein
MTIFENIFWGHFRKQPQTVRPFVRHFEFCDGYYGCKKSTIDLFGIAAMVPAAEALKKRPRVHRVSCVSFLAQGPRSSAQSSTAGSAVSKAVTGDHFQFAG